MNIKSTLLSVSLVLSSVAFNAIAAASPKTFGSGANTDNVSKISTILASPDDYLDEDVTIKGTIVKVCKKRGCWMELTSDKKFQTFRVKVRDESRLESFWSDPLAISMPRNSISLNFFSRFELLSNYFNLFMKNIMK